MRSVGSLPPAAATDVGSTSSRAAGHRIELRLASQVPLADHAGVVAGSLQQLGKGHLTARQAESLGQIALRRSIVVLEAEALLIPASHQPGARGSAHRRRCVAIGKADSLQADTIDVGGLEAVNLV